jgi:hypothetical protein
MIALIRTDEHRREEKTGLDDHARRALIGAD